MISNVAIAVVIPSYRVRRRILGVIAGIGPEVSRIYVVDDKCPDGSGALVRSECTDPRVKVVFHAENQGVGGAVMTDYRAAIEDGMTVIVKVDGDGQMDPRLIPAFVAPIVEGEADYVKGNRFFDLEKIRSMPPLRLFGNALLSFMTKLSSGYRVGPRRRRDPGGYRDAGSGADPDGHAADPRLYRPRYRVGSEAPAAKEGLPAAPAMRQLSVLSPQMATYIAGGPLCTAIDVGLMQLLIANHVNPFVATTAGFLTSLIVNYVFHARVTFKNVNSAATFTRYLCVVALNYLITLGIVAISLSLTGVALYGKLISLAVISVNGFLLGKCWIFKAD